MAHTYNYAILQLTPFAHRDEVINVGVAVFLTTGLQVRLGAPPALLSYFGIQSSTLDWAVENLVKGDNPTLSIHERTSELQKFSGVRLTEIGWFLTDDDSQYERRIAEILAEYVDKPQVRRTRKERNNINRDLKKIFKDYDVFSSKSEDIHKHKIVANMPVGPSGKLHVDFLLKNGLFHATETLDFRMSDEAGPTELKNAALASVTFRHARDVLGLQNTKCYLVYAASTIVENAVAPAIEIASRDVNEIFNIESREDREKYLDLMLSAAGVNHLFS